MTKQINTLIFLRLSITGVSQKLNSSPYSFFEIDDSASLKSVEEIGMGKIGATLNSPYRLSFTNPASYSSLVNTAYVFSGAEYTFRNAISYTGKLVLDQDVYSYDNSSMMSVGGFFTPKFNSVTSYFLKVTNRGGRPYTKTGLTILDNEINDYGISFGVSLPVSLNISNFNLGFEPGKRGDNNGILIEEKYFNFRLSLSLNDKWFRKRKLD